MINVIPVRRKDTDIGHIQDHNVSFRNYHYACLYLSIHRADIGVYAKNRKKCRSTVKTELKHLHKFKSYGQNKIVFKI